MPTDDPRLEQALHDAAPSVTTSGVVAEVSQRRTRRRRNRRLGAVALALVALVVVSTLAVLVTRDDGSSPNIASPGAGLRVRVIDGDADVSGDAGVTRTPTQVVLDQDAHVLRAPMVVGNTGLSIASYDPGADGVALSHVVRVEGAHVVDIVDLKAHILSITEGEGARWVLTQNLRASPGGKIPDTFLKRVTGPGLPQSKLLPLDSDPVGPIAAVGGAVWVPLRDGVLQYDSAGTFVRKISLPPADHRWVAQVGKLAAVTDGKRLRTLDVTGAAGVSSTYASEIDGLAAAGFESRVLLAAADGERAQVVRATSQKPGVTTTLPRGFEPTGLEASPTQVWVTGVVDGAPAIALLGERGVRATVVLENASNGAALAWTDDDTVRAVSDGKLYDVTVP